MPDGAPWENYQQGDGPWAKYGGSSAPPPPVNPDHPVRPEDFGMPNANQQAQAVIKKPALQASKEFAKTLDPQDKYLYNLPEKERGVASERMDSGQSMAVPAFLMGAGAGGPVGLVERKGLLGAAKTIGAGLARGAVGTYAGSKVGEDVGRPIGKFLGNENAGGTVGRTIGGLSGGIAATYNPSSLAKLPFGVGRMVTTDEEYAGVLAARKLAQRNADIAAGLRPRPAPSVALSRGGQIPADKLAAFMNKGYAPLALQESAANLRPLRPLVGTPEEWNAYDQQKSILGSEAKDAGLYHAARGSAKKSTNLQQRLGRTLRK